MGAVMKIYPAPGIGPWVRNLRLYLKLNRKEIARLARATIEDIILLEDSKPVSLDIRSRILKELHKIRIRNWEMLTNC
jgi:hypothetical protein